MSGQVGSDLFVQVKGQRMIRFYVQVLSTEEEKQRRSRGESAAQRGAAVKATLAAAFAVAAIVAVCLAATNQVRH